MRSDDIYTRRPSRAQTVHQAIRSAFRVWLLVVVVAMFALPAALPLFTAPAPIAAGTGEMPHIPFVIPSGLTPATTPPTTIFPCSGSTGIAGFGGLGGGGIIVGKLAPDGEYILVTVPQLTGQSGFTDCGTVFGNTLDIYDVSPLPYNATATVNYEEFNPTNNSIVVAHLAQSFSITGHAVTEFGVTLPPTTQQHPFLLSVDGVQFVGYHLTPLTLLPNNILTAGGLDLLVILIISETGILLAPLILLSKFLVTKAQYAPKFRLLLWTVAMGVITFFLLLTQYQWLDTTFGGLSYLVYPIVFAFLLFLWSLHLFNRAEVAEVLKIAPASGHRLRYLRWTMLVATLKDGSLVVIDPRWRGFLYALFGHFAKLSSSQSEALGPDEPAPSPVENRIALPRHVIERRLQRDLPSKSKPTDDFIVLNAEKYHEPTKLFWVDSDEPFDIRYSHMSWHREVTVPPKLSPEGEVLVPEHTKQKLTWPHIIDPETNVRIAGIHYWTAPVAAQGWMGSEKVSALLEKRTYQMVVLRGRQMNEADRLAEERVAEVMSMLEKVRAPPTEEELAQEIERLDKTGLRGEDLWTRLLGIRPPASEKAVKAPGPTQFHPKASRER